VIIAPKRGRCRCRCIRQFDALANLGIERDAWYWEVEACPTNRRVLINAAAGEPSPVHPWVLCGGVERRGAETIKPFLEAELYSQPVLRISKGLS
jgi:hypothetical protein